MAAPSTAATAVGSHGEAPGRRLHPATVAVAVLVGLLSVWHALEGSQHLLTDRDPGVYVTAARWLAREGSILADPAVGPFAGHPDLGFEEQGWNIDDDGRLEPQFLHLLPVILAGAHRVGGDRLLLLAPVAIAGLALLAFHAFARRVLRPWWALVATGALAVSMPWVHLSRDAFSEPLAVLLLFGGLCFVWDAQSKQTSGLALCGGLLLGAVAMARVEGFVALLPLMACVAAWLVRAELAEEAARATARRSAGALVAGVLATVALALLDLRWFATWYLDDLRSLLATVAAGFAAVVLVGTLTLAVTARRQRTPCPEQVEGRGGRRARHSRTDGVGVEGADRDGRRTGRHRSTVAGGVALTVVVLAGAAWFLRPALSTVTGPASPAIAALEHREGLPAAGVRRYSEHSFAWLSWYIGPVALAAGVAGVAIIARRLVVGGPGRDLRVVPFLAIFTTISVLYLWRPSIVPDHVWVMRRYAIVTVPGVLLLAALTGQDLSHRLGGRLLKPAGRALAGVVAAFTLGFPLATVVPVARATTQEGMLDKVGEVCDAVGPEGALVVLRGRDLEIIAAQAFRSFCGVPVAIAAPTFDRADVVDLASAWGAQGRALHLVGDDAAEVEALAGRSPELVTIVANDQQIEATLTERPDELVAVPFAFVVAHASPEVRAG